MVARPNATDDWKPAKGQATRIDRLLPLIHEIRDLRRSGKSNGEVFGRLAKVAGVSVRTAYRLVARYEVHGDMGLGRKQPSNAAQARVHVSRRFDRAVGDPVVLAMISGDLDLSLRSLWKSSLSTAGAKVIGTAASNYLSARCSALGLDIPATALAIPRHRIERFKADKIVHQRKADRKAFNDGAPRIKLAWSQLAPMDAVIGDVKHLDLVVARDDGTHAYPKMVAFEDGGTGRVFFRVFLLERGEQIRREQVTETFIAMVADPEWGFPKRLTIDNGSEFKAFGHLRGVFASLGRDGVSGIFNTRPYSPQSKPVEGWFGRFDNWGIGQIPGYVGSDRLNKKVETMGRPTKPFSGSFAELQDLIASLADRFAMLPVSGDRGDRSPTDIFADHVARGWRPMAVNPLVLSAAFCRIGKAQVDRGKLKIDGQHFHHRSLDRLPHRTKVEVAHPWRRGGPLLYRALGELEWILLEVERAFHPFDPQGAKEASRRRANYVKAVIARDRQSPTIDPIAALLAARPSKRQATLIGAGSEVDVGQAAIALAQAIAEAPVHAALNDDSVERQLRAKRVARLHQLDGQIHPQPK